TARGRAARGDQTAVRPEEPAQPGEEARARGRRRRDPGRDAQLMRLGLAVQAEALGYDSAWAAEAWGTDAVTVLAWLGARTTRLKLGAGILQIPARTPAMTAMTAATLDLMSGGRFLLGLGTSAPPV